MRGHDAQTQSFLASLRGVLGVDVWIDDGRVRAQVTVAERSAWSPVSLKIACAEALGLHKTPNDIWIQEALRPAA